MSSLPVLRELSAKLRNKTKLFFLQPTSLERFGGHSYSDISGQLTASTAHSQHSARPAQLTASTAHRRQHSSRPAQLKASTSHDQQSSLLVTVNRADLSCAGAVSCAGCAGDSGKNLDSRTLDHDVVIMMDHGDVVAMSHIHGAIIHHGDAFV